MDDWITLDPYELARSKVEPALMKQVPNLFAINTAWDLSAAPMIGGPKKFIILPAYREQHVFTIHDLTQDHITTRLVKATLDRIADCIHAHAEAKMHNPSVWFYSRLPMFYISPAGHLRIEIESYLGVI
jgi:hypothetical protein